MVTFSCKKITQEELIRCSLNLNKTEYNVLMYLLKHNKLLKVIEIADALKLERTSVQKALKSLFKKDLVIRQQKNISAGGYVYFYQAKNKEAIKETMKKITYEWYKNVERMIDSL